MSDISNQMFSSSRNICSIFEAAIVLPFAKNCTIPQKVRQNLEHHFADSIEGDPHHITFCCSILPLPSVDDNDLQNQILFYSTD